MKDTLEMINRMQADGVIGKYPIGMLSFLSGNGLRANF